MKKILKSKSGMTLVEIVAALVIIILLFTGIFALISVSATTIFLSGEETRANADGRTRTDTILAGGFTNASDMEVTDISTYGFLVSAGYTNATITWDDGTSHSIDDVIDATVTVPAAGGRDFRYRVFGTPVP